MPSVFDVAAYILSKAQPPVTAMKLQKLVYYAQAWSTVWDEEALFPERIQAWANGPVVPELFQKLKGQFNVYKHNLDGADPDKLSPQQKATVDTVLDFYGKRDPQYLSDLTHMEDPWVKARRGLSPGVRTDREISLAAMQEYYGSL